MNLEELEEKIRQILLDVYHDNHCFDHDIIQNSVNDIMRLLKEDNQK